MSTASIDMLCEDVIDTCKAGVKQIDEDRIELVAQDIAKVKKSRGRFPTCLFKAFFSSDETLRKVFSDRHKTLYDWQRRDLIALSNRAIYVQSHWDKSKGSKPSMKITGGDWANMAFALTEAVVLNKKS